MTQPSPHKPNPFRDAPANPYAAPASALAESTLAPHEALALEKVRGRVQIPAIGILLSSLLSMLATAMLMIALARDEEVMADMDAIEAVSFIAFSSALCLAQPIASLAGAILMLRVRAYSLTFASVIASLLPCSLCFPLSIGFSIWAITVLTDQRVRWAFYKESNPYKNQTP